MYNKLLAGFLAVLITSTGHASTTLNQNSANVPNQQNTDYVNLKEKLVGTWILQSYVEIPIDGSAPFYPLGQKATGIIMYTPDGYMSAQLMGEKRTKFQSGDWFNGSDDEYIDEAKTYIAYSGRFFIDQQTKQLKHEMLVSLFPNWIGQQQERLVSLEGDLLKLGPASPILSKGKRVMSQLVWKRAKEN